MALESTCPEMIVCEALSAATDPNHEIVSKAEIFLSEWEVQSGFFPTLVRIFQNEQLEVKVRWMAAVYLKNGISKYWRRNNKYNLNPGEKDEIRRLLLSNLTEPIPQVALQVAVLVSRIARIDGPREWPELVTELLKLLQNSEQVQQQRVMFVFYHVIKALASKRTMIDKRIFEELAISIYGYIYELWDGFTNLYFHQLNGHCSSDMTIASMERALLTLRILRKLTIFGFSKPHNSELCMRFVELVFERLKQCLECRYELRCLNASEDMLALLEKFILKQMKILNEFLEMHTTSFVRFIGTALTFSFKYVFHDGVYLIFSENVINFPQFVIHCINLMKGVLINESRNSTGIILEFFSNERLCYMCEKIMTHYFLLTQAELDQWATDPEFFAQDDGGESWKYTLRPCIESFFLTMISHFQKECTAEVVQYINKAQEIQLSSNSDVKDILLKDSIYNAAGIASLYLFNEINFDVWFSAQLLAELKVDSDNFRILRRRIIWLLAQWTRVKFSRELRPLAYQSCLHLLRHNENMSIRLAASKTLNCLITDFEFCPDEFRAYLELSFNALFVLLREAKECDTKMNVLTTMSVIVEKMSDHIRIHADKLITYLPLLWNESEDYNMLRCAIICTLQQLIKAIRYIPDSITPFLYTIIQLSTDPQEPSHIYLMEEGLTLWLAVVENSTTLSPKLFELCHLLLPIIEMSSENLRTVLILIQAYILLDARAYLEHYGQPLVDFCTRMFEDIRAEGIVLMVKVFETYLKTEPNYGLQLVRPALPYIFKQVYINKDYPMLMSMYLMMVARVLLINQNVFMSILEEIEQPNPLETILDVWIAKMPLATELEKRKLFCLAFCSMFSSNPIVMERFSGIMRNISETLKELMREVDETDEGIGDDGDGTAGTTTAITTRSSVPTAVAAATAATSASSSSSAAAAAVSASAAASAASATATTVPTVAAATASALASSADRKTASQQIKYCDSLVFVDEDDLNTSSYCTMDDFVYKTYHYDRCRLLSLKDPVHKIVLTECIEWHLGVLRSQLGDVSYQQLMKSVDPPALGRIGVYVNLGLQFGLPCTAT